ncbi:TrbG/VirB9 family P-type conjugative transfer protein [Fluviibacter phosphoraccumulans]|uniref:P-type conjugative transfer protein VirB9 n=1 Tax=Fluviibacter phosphoraccumulans TaxID=1751046 RepID=A0A7R6R6C1_9RHOO|nr:TrbG/VirB9 family P-type conjugative transfer protein [Fluviibacter phosphoraccumulans]BBU69020.1 P-type conjugative transfer protein VirB9 [Fluviibacter phosphoraccumulans]BBU71813.1 P-type conjugative transfer protein VirB9 [Fluviibacter phosphoraccumulans]
MISLRQIFIAIIASLSLVSGFVSAAPLKFQRIMVLDYDEDAQDKSIPILTKRGFVTQIDFGKGEAIESLGATSQAAALTGDADGWIVVGRKGDRHLYLKPKSEAYPSNLLVVTNRYNYAFELRILPDESRSDGVWRLSFRYPNDGLSNAEVRANQVANALGSPTEKRNLKYRIELIRGNGDILPKKAWDDGRFTYIAMGNNREIPAAFKVDGNDGESTVNLHTEGQLLVIHEVARRFLLRLDKQEVGIWNEAFDPDGMANTTGTASSEVVREVVQPETMPLPMGGR